MLTRPLMRRRRGRKRALRCVGGAPEGAKEWRGEDKEENGPGKNGPAIKGGGQTLHGNDGRTGLRNRRSKRDGECHLASRCLLRNAPRSASAPNSLFLRKVPRSLAPCISAESPVSLFRMIGRQRKRKQEVIANSHSQPPWRWAASFCASAQIVWRF